MQPSRPILSLARQCDDDAFVRLGGAFVYARDDHALNSAMNCATETIGRHSSGHLSLTRANLRNLVKTELGEAEDDRLFGALLGLQLRRGQIDSVVCAAPSGKTFRVFVHVTRIDEFHDCVRRTIEQLRELRVVELCHVEQAVFSQRRWGTWSSTSHILARMMFLGTACPLDRTTFAWPIGLEDAFR